MSTVRETFAKSILTGSNIPGVDYCVNPYTGCLHACRYCYADFMKRFTGHRERWGDFADVKVNAPILLAKELARKKPGTVMMSSVTDPYQPIEETYRITRRCLEELLPSRFPLRILTKSPLVTRDIDLFKKFDHIDVGITITTDDEGMRALFEPGASPISARIEALGELHGAGVRTYVFIGPLLPQNPERLAKKIAPHAGSVLIDRMNYARKTVRTYRTLKLTRWLDADFTEGIIGRLVTGLEGVPVDLC